MAQLAGEQKAMLDGAQAPRDARTADVSTVAEAVEACAQACAQVPWSAVAEAGEDEMAQSAITVRCLTRVDGSVPDSDTEPDLVAYVVAPTDRGRRHQLTIPWKSRANGWRTATLDGAPSRIGYWERTTLWLLDGSRMKAVTVAEADRRP